MLSKLVHFLYWLGVVSLGATGYFAWHLHCESFGCMGLGVAWMMWAGLYLLIVGLGVAAFSKVSDRLHFKINSVALFAQLLMGALALLHWLKK